MTARAAIRSADLVRIATAMERAGVREYRIEARPDGSIAVSVGRGKVNEGVNPWDALEDAET